MSADLATFDDLARVFLAADEPGAAPPPPASATRRRLPVWPRYAACGEAQARPCARTACDYYLPDPAPWADLGEDDGIPDHVSCALDVASVPWVVNASASVREVDGREQDVVAELLGITGERVRQIVRTAGQRYAAARRRLGYDEGEELSGEDVGQRRARLRRERMDREAGETAAQAVLPWGRS
jgi:hypothetical protein